MGDETPLPTAACHSYASLVGRESVIAGTDCGMGMRVHPQIAWAELKALNEGATLASKELSQ